MVATKQYGIKRFVKRFLFSIAYKSFFITSSMRIKLLRMCGVKIGNNCFIGQFVLFDDLYPSNIEIGDNCVITTGTKILSHFYDTSKRVFVSGNVKINQNSFIGMNTIITKPVIIGENSIIGAGSVITKNIEGNGVFGGVPCNFIKKIEM